MVHPILLLMLALLVVVAPVATVLCRGHSAPLAESMLSTDTTTSSLGTRARDVMDMFKSVPSST